MAASKKRTTKKRTTSNKKKTTTKSKARSKKQTNRMLVGSLIVLSWVLGIIVLFSLGILGRYLNHALRVVMGNFLYLLIPVSIVYGFEYIWNNGKIDLPQRTYWGFGIFALCWMLTFALMKTKASDPWIAMNVLKTSLSQFGQAGFTCAYGFIGAFVAGLLTSMFSKMGAIVVATGLAIISFALMFWNVMHLEKRKEDLQLSHQEHVEKRRQQKVQAQLDQEAQHELDQAPKSSMLNWLFQPENEVEEQEESELQQSNSPQIFQNGILADDPILDEYRDPDFMEQLELPIEEHKSTSKLKRNHHEQDDFDIDLDLPSAYQPSQAPIQEPTPKVVDIAAMLGLDQPTKNERANSLPTNEPTIPVQEQKEVQEPQQTVVELVPVMNSAANDENQVEEEVEEKLKDVSIYGQNMNSNQSSSSVVGNANLEENVSTSLAHASKENKRPTYAKKEEEANYRSYNAKTYKLPPLRLLEDPVQNGNSSVNVKNAKVQGARLIEILKEFNVDATLGEIHIGPSVTEFEVIPGQGVRVNTFVNLQSDIKLALAAKDIRVEAPIPGKSAVGIEVPNAEKTTVMMKELIRSVPQSLADKPLVFTLGKDLMGNNVYGRLDTMPHLLIAGATGSGKSVCVNSIICSILLRTRPDEVKLLLVDPKKVEFTPYNGVPHLLSPVITDANLANGALKVIVEMMDQRYSMFEEVSVRNITSYNKFVANHPELNKEKLPRIVVIIDELADLMLAASKEVEQSIQRITQLARAAGIHLIVATQRPSVNVITGVIKANIPSRIAFMVSSRPDSRTILDQIGAEKLLGYGDMLFMDNSDPVRIQGVFIQDHEVEAICNYVKQQASPQYEDAFVMLKEISSQGQEVNDFQEELDPLYPEVKNFVIVSRKASTSLIQRRFRLGYGRAARILDQLEANGIIGPANGTRPREILVEAPDAYAEDF